MRDADLGSRNTTWFYVLALGVLLLDQITKAVARGVLEFDKSVTVIPGFFDLKLSYNEGAAFGVLPNWAPLFIIVALAAVFAVVKLRSAGPHSRLLSVGLGLLLGGGLGNLVDRLVSPARAVTDFLSFHVAIRGKTYQWPTFNVADAAIVVGAILVLFFVYVIQKREAAQ